MEVTLLENNALRIKGKKASIIVDPKKGVPKQTADAILLLQNGEYDPTRVEGARVVVKDPGEYEVGGIKLTGQALDGAIFYNINIDNTDMVLANASTLSKFKDLITEPNIAILNADSEFDPESIAAIEPRVVLVYGEHSKQALKSLGKEEMTGVKKFTQTKESLPEETQIVWLA
jgi:hypothetical protein